MTRRTTTKILHGDGVSWLQLPDGTMVSVRGPRAREHALIIAGTYTAQPLQLSLEERAQLEGQR